MSACLFVWAATAANAAEVSASVQPDKVRPNQVFSYTITIKNGKPDAMPNLRLPLQIGQVSAPSIGQNLRFINGVSSSEVVISWGLTAQEPGDFVIAPQDLVVGGQAMKTNEVKLTVVNGGDAPGPGSGDDPTMPLLQIEVGKREIYLGEVVPISAALYYPREVGLRRAGLIEIDKNDFAIQRFPMQSEQGMTVINGAGYVVQTFRSTLAALRAGDLKAGPATMEIIVEVPMRGNFPPGMFGVPTEPRRIKLKSQEVPVKVLPLPAEGKPASFSGAVGEFTLGMSASPTDVKVGDPISIELTVTGSGNFDAITPPALASEDGWKTYPARRYNVDTNGIDPSLLPVTMERKLGFSTVIVPEKTHETIPPFELSYFSPAQKKYVTLKSDPVAIKVKAEPAPAVAAADAAAAGGDAAAKPAFVPQPQATLSDILLHTPAHAAWISPSGGMLIRRPWFWLAVAAPALVLLLAGSVRAMRHRRLLAEQGPAGEIRRAWRSLNEGSLGEAEFLRRAAQFIHVVHADEPDPARRAEAVNEALRHYLRRNFSSDGADQPALAAAERQSILNGLDALRQASLDKVAELPPVPARPARSAAVAAALLAMAVLLPPSTIHAVEPTPDDLYQQAVQALKDEDYTRAQYIGEALTRRDPPDLSPQVFELIGHARFKKDDLGRAALWYQRAALFLPREPELRQNLRLLDEKVRPFLITQDSPPREWSLYLSHNEWFMLGAAGLWLILGAVAVKMWRKRLGVPGVAAIVLGALVLAGAATFAILRPTGASRVQDVSVVTAKDTRAYSGAAHTASEVIDLPPGSQVRVKEKRGSWAYVEIPTTPESLRGWVDAAALTPLWTWDPAVVP